MEDDFGVGPGQEAVAEGNKPPPDRVTLTFEAMERCLFVAPGAPEGDFTPEGEGAAKAAGARGGFVCLRFRKK